MGFGRGTGKPYSIRHQCWLIPIFLLLIVLVWLSNYSINPKSFPGLSNINYSELKQYILHILEHEYMTTHSASSGAQKLDRYPPVKALPDSHQLRILVTGGAGFIGSHLVDHLMFSGHQVIVIDNLFSGRKSNIQQWIGHPNFEFIQHDIIQPIMLEVDQIYHLASPSSPSHYEQNALQTIRTCITGTMNMLGTMNMYHLTGTCITGTMNMLGLAKRVKVQYN